MPIFQEPVSEQIQAQTVVVIHPGSRNLRIGRASDYNCKTVTHAIARRRSEICRAGVYSDQVLPEEVKLSKESIQEMKDARLQVSHVLQSCLRSDGSRRYATPPQMVASFNKRVKPKFIGTCTDEWTPTDREVIVGDEVLKLNPDSPYNIHFPMSRGELNIHGNVGGSLTSVLADLEVIWQYCIQNLLEIPLKDLKHYRAVLVVPDIYNRSHLKHLMSLLLNELGFGMCFLIQDHVAATFGAGVGYACVVDVGDQKTSISCVDDGISHPDTRVRFEHGGGDICRVLQWLLQTCGFPYKQWSSRDKLDCLLMQELKETLCHVNLDTCGSQEKTFLIQRPNEPIRKFTIQVGDECIIAPLSLFNQGMLNITGKKNVQSQKRNTGDPEDPHDENYLKETSRRGQKEALDSSLPSGEGVGTETGAMDSSQLDEDIVVDNMDPAVPMSSKDYESRDFQWDQQLSLDQAILQSIERCPTDDLKRKMYSCILVIGGGLKFEGIGKWLQNRISLQIPYMYRAEQLDIITFPKDIDPQITTWKGASIMSCLETAQELWITQREWSSIGMKILRERAPFMW